MFQKYIGWSQGPKIWYYATDLNLGLPTANQSTVVLILFFNLTWICCRGKKLQKYLSEIREDQTIPNLSQLEPDPWSLDRSARVYEFLEWRFGFWLQFVWNWLFVKDCQNMSIDLFQSWEFFKQTNIYKHIT